ncbi:sensor histidine kinase [Rhodococcus sp. IEGM 1330]|uniref:sensor histidine kinase n=1 Tax=Rhodococcus sp. IEGM 1330 TaxID=3082225 RepID=UPI002955AE1C|nr:sensor histidine kinase [Rhodococcus sp. IEGM 1330]MDV8022351.1 sensor histidine kinase [Rhodococcus sp. IEGM 1330]
MTTFTADLPEGRIWRFGWLFGAIWLVYLIYPLNEILSLESVPSRAFGIVVILGFAAVFTTTFWRFRNGHRRGNPLSVSQAWVALGAMAVLTVSMCVLIGTTGFGATVYIAVLAMMTLPVRQAWIFVAVMVVFVEVVPRFISSWVPDNFFAFQLLISAAAAWGITQVFQRNHELAVARQQLADLAIVAERERMSRDVHDILGHSLTVITVKSELAGRLIEIDPARAAVEIAELETLARQALADVRSTVGGMRQVDIGSELASARTALTAAGIDADLPGDADVVPLRHRELFGWVIREAVTNVVRHSSARHCRVTLTASSISIVDDGVGPADKQSGGNGLRGLGERVTAAGGALTIARVSTGGFKVEVSAE